MCKRQRLFENTRELLTDMQQNPSWEANPFSAGQEIPPCYKTRKFIAVFEWPRPGNYVTKQGNYWKEDESL